MAVTRIDASADAVWTVLTDPAFVERLEPRARLISSEGAPGKPGARTRVRLLGVVMDQVVVEAVVGEQLIFAGQSASDGRQTAEQRADLRQDGGSVVLTWTVTQGRAPAVVRWLSATMCRFALRKWLARVRHESTSLTSA